MIRLHLVTLVFLITLVFCQGIDNFFAFTTDDEGKPDVNVTAVRESNATLPCLIDSTDPSIVVVWMDKYDNVLYYDESRMIDDARFRLVKENGCWNLTISQVDTEDEGRYRCVANTSPIQLVFFQLTVFVPSRILVDQSSRDVDVKEGETVELFCNVTGYPPPTLSWTVRNGSEPANSANIRRIQQSGPRLLIQNVSRYVDEIYTCSASNGFKYPATHEIRLRVRYQPILKIWPGKILKSAGDSVDLTCQGQGYRQPTMHFSKDGLEISDNGDKYVYTRSVSGHWTKMTLRINYLEQADFGYYRCVAINSMGRATKFIELKEQRRQTSETEMQETPSQITTRSTQPTTRSTQPTTRSTQPTTRSTQPTTTKQLMLPPELKNKDNQQSNPPIAQGSTSNSGANNWSRQIVYILAIYHIIHLMCEML